jgi:hypothetical protein
LQFRYRGSRSESAVAQLFSLGASMKLSRHLMVILLMAVALTASAQLFLVKRLVPKNVSTDDHFVFNIISSKIGSSAHFSITVTPKKAVHLLSTDVRVMVFDGTGEISQMSLNDQGQEKGKPYHYTFDIGASYLAYSQFIFRYSDWTNHISSEDDADSIYFLLRDFKP